MGIEGLLIHILGDLRMEPLPTSRRGIWESAASGEWKAGMSLCEGPLETFLFWPGEEGETGGLPKVTRKPTTPLGLTSRALDAWLSTPSFLPFPPPRAKRKLSWLAGHRLTWLSPAWVQTEAASHGMGFGDGDSGTTWASSTQSESTKGGHRLS